MPWQAGSPRRALEQARTGLLAGPHRADAAVAAAPGTSTSAAGRARRPLEAASLIGPVPTSERARSPYPRQLRAAQAAIIAGTQTPREVTERAGCPPQAPLMNGRTHPSIAHRRYHLRHHQHISGIRG